MPDFAFLCGSFLGSFNLSNHTQNNSRVYLSNTNTKSIKGSDRYLPMVQTQIDTDPDSSIFSIRGYSWFCKSPFIVALYSNERAKKKKKTIYLSIYLSIYLYHNSFNLVFVKFSSKFQCSQHFSLYHRRIHLI